MKKLLIVLLVLMLLPISFATAEDNNFMFAGMRYDDAPLLSIGVGTQISGQLFLLSYTDIGYYGSFATELAYFMKLSDGFKFGLLAGPDVDWIDIGPEGQPTLAYIVGAGGMIASYDFNPKMGLWIYGKYKFTFEDDNLYQDGFVIGGGGHFWF